MRHLLYNFAPLVLLTCLIHCAFSPTALAQTDEEDLNRARQLFSEGVDLADQAQWADAAERFRGALEIREAAAVKYNLASALIEMNQYREAYRLLGEVGQDPEASDDQKALARASRAEIEAEAGAIEVEAIGGTGAETVVIDGEPLSSSERGGVVYVAPGAHEVELRDDSGTQGSTTVNVAAGQRETAYVSVETAEDPLSQSSESSSTEGDMLLWGGVVVGVVVLIGIIAVAANGEGAGSVPPAQALPSIGGFRF